MKTDIHSFFSIRLSIQYVNKIVVKIKATLFLCFTDNLNVAAATAAKSLQSCSTLCDPIDVSPPGSPVPGILQARTLEWVAMSFSNA